jgi:hypothetical protein
MQSHGPGRAKQDVLPAGSKDGFTPTRTMTSRDRLPPPRTSLPPHPPPYRTPYSSFGSVTDTIPVSKQDPNLPQVRTSYLPLNESRIRLFSALSEGLNLTFAPCSSRLLLILQL